MQPYGALTLFFRWRKKSVQKKASGTATPGKRLLLPILTAGLAMSRAAWLASLRLPSCALGARLFPPSKWAGLFPSAAYRRSAPAQLAVGKLTPCKWRCFVVAGRFCGVDKWADFLCPSVGVGQAYPLQGGIFQCSLYILATQKASVDLKSRWPFVLQKYTSHIETSQPARGAYAHSQLRRSRAAIGSEGKKARPF